MEEVWEENEVEKGERRCGDAALGANFLISKSTLAEAVSGPASIKLEVSCGAILLAYPRKPGSTQAVSSLDAKQTHLPS